MRWFRSLKVRLLASYLAVVAIGAGVMWLVSRQLAPEEFQQRLRLGAGGFGRGGGAATTEIQDAATGAIDAALLAGMIAAVVAAAIVAVVVGMRFLRPIASVRRAASAMADGDYSHRVPIPAEGELADLAHSINSLGAALEETERRRTRLIGEVAHELRSPLTTIGGYMEALLDGVREPSDEVFAAVASEAGRLHRLADDLTILSQAEEGALHLDRQAVDLADLTAAAAAKLSLQFEHRHVTLHLGGDPAPVMGDPDRLTQVLINLLGNSLTYTPDGGRVTLTTGRTGETAWAEVVDTGKGIAADDLERIFERFYRLPDPAHPAGRGIGLTIARSVARAHRGDIVAMSAGLGRGATFRLTLPAAAPPD